MILKGQEGSLTIRLKYGKQPPARTPSIFVTLDSA